MSYFDIETPEGQAAAEAQEDAAVIDRAMKHEFPGEWLAKACRVGNVKGPRRERLQALLAARVELIDTDTIEEGLAPGLFTVSQAQGADS